MGLFGRSRWDGGERTKAEMMVAGFENAEALAEMGLWESTTEPTTEQRNAAMAIAVKRRHAGLARIGGEEVFLDSLERVEARNPSLDVTALITMALKDCGYLEPDRQLLAH